MKISRLLPAFAALLLLSGPAAAPAPAGIPSALLERIAGDQRSATLQATDAGGRPFGRPRWHLVHPPAGLRSYVDAGGIEFLPRDADPAWSVTFKLEGEAIRGLSGAGPRITAFRGGIDEILEHCDAGLEHSYLVREWPGDSATLRIRVEARGTASAVSSSEDEIRFGSAMAYGGLKVYDATGRRLAARMTWKAPAIELAVLERGEFPILVDPIASSPDWTFEETVNTSNLGAAMAGAGDVNGDGFDDVIIGAPGFDGGHSNEGRVYVFAGSPVGLLATPMAGTPIEANSIDARFGEAVAGAGRIDADGFDDILVGAPGFRLLANAPQLGKAYLYRGSAGGVVSTPAEAWSITGATANTRVGQSVAAAGDVDGDGLGDVVVGAPGNSNGTGRVYLHRGTGAAPWLTATASQQINAPAGSQSFGDTVAYAGDVNRDGHVDLLVSDSDYEQGAILGLGRVHLHLGDGAGAFSAAPSWTATGTFFAGYLGMDSVAAAGDVNGDGCDDFVIGSGLFSDGDGIVQVYFGHPGGLPSPTPDVTIAGHDEGLGSSVAGIGDLTGDGYDDLLVGVSGRLTAPSQYGAAEIYAGGPAGPSSPPILTLNGPAGGNFGGKVAAAGDVNGNGWPDIIVGAPFALASSRGAAYAWTDLLAPPAIAAGSVAIFRADGTTPIPAGGMTNQASIVLQALVVDPNGDDGGLEVQVVPTGGSFPPPPASVTAGPILASGLPSTVLVPGLATGTSFAIRVRPVNASGSRGPWIHVGTEDPNETDLETMVNLAPTEPSLSIVATPTGDAIPTGGSASNGGPIEFQAPVTGEPNLNACRLEVEFRPVAQAFTGVPTDFSPMTPHGGLARVERSAAPGSYKVMSRWVDEHGLPGAWEACGDNGPDDVDFRIFTEGSLNTKASCGSSAAGGTGVAALLVAAVLLGGQWSDWRRRRASASMRSTSAR